VIHGLGHQLPLDWWRGWQRCYHSGDWLRVQQITAKERSAERIMARLDAIEEDGT
jgi:hypothetical protein